MIFYFTETIPVNGKMKCFRMFRSLPFHAHFFPFMTRHIKRKSQFENKKREKRRRGEVWYGDLIFDCDENSLAEVHISSALREFRMRVLNEKSCKTFQENSPFTHGEFFLSLTFIKHRILDIILEFLKVITFRRSRWERYKNFWNFLPKI